VNATKAQNVTMRGNKMTRKIPAVLAFQESRSDIATSEASKKRSTPVAMAAPVTIVLNVIADDVVDVRLLMLELLVVNVEISDITRTMRAYWYKRVALCGQHASHRAPLSF
jgi:hypothetical protein